MTTRLALLAAVLFAPAAHAEVNRCSSADVDVRYQNVLFNEMSGDTGWFPQGYSAQLRITGRVAGQTKVAMGLRPTACWNGAMMASVPGRAGAGVLDFAYGAELHLYGQIHTSVLGYQIDWMGEFPLPTDFLLGKTTMFDPTLLPGSPVDHVSGTDTTSPLKLFSTDLIGDYIGISGISGGLHLDAIGVLTTTYSTSSVAVGQGAIATATGAAALAAPTSGYANALELSVAAAGTLRYAPALTFNVGFNVKILGIQVANWTLYSVTLPLSHFDSMITLDPAMAHIPLPKAHSLDGARIDFAAGTTQQLAIHNSGEAPLMIEPMSLPGSVTAQPITVAPGADGMLALTASSSFAGQVDATLATNDPGQPSVTIMLGRDIGGTGLPDDESSQASGCCDSRGGGGSTGALGALFGLALWRRRRRA